MGERAPMKDQEPQRSYSLDAELAHLSFPAKRADVEKDDISERTEGAGNENPEPSPRAQTNAHAAGSSRSRVEARRNPVAWFERKGIVDVVAGEKPVLNRSDSVPARAVSQTHPISLRIDVPMLLIVFTLVIYGLVMVYSASWQYSIADTGAPTSIFIKQLAWTSVGIIFGGVAAWVNYHRWNKLALWLLGFTIAALFAVLLFQNERNGAVRTLLGGSIQPSELAKLAVIIYLSVWLYNRSDTLNDLGIGLAPLSIILSIVGVAIFFQPDLSAVLTVLALGGMMFFLAGGEWRQIFFVLIAAIVLGLLLVTVIPAGKARIMSFIAGIRDPLQSSDHVQRAIESIIKGGWFGVGIGKAENKLTILPFPQTDSIFAVIGEETGVVGGALLVLLYMLMMWRSLVIARRAPDQLGMLLASGLSLWVTLEALINIGAMVGILPFAGNALPLISAGGSNRVVVLTAMGIILNVSRLSEQQKEEERAISAVIDLRRRNWRRSIPSPRRPSNPHGQS
jgi:cell division protein FtsW